MFHKTSSFKSNIRAVPNLNIFFSKPYSEGTSHRGVKKGLEIKYSCRNAGVIKC